MNNPRTSDLALIILNMYNIQYLSDYESDCERGIIDLTKKKFVSPQIRELICKLLDINNTFEGDLDLLHSYIQAENIDNPDKFRRQEGEATKFYSWYTTYIDNIQSLDSCEYDLDFLKTDTQRSSALFIYFFGLDGF